MVRSETESCNWAHTHTLSGFGLDLVIHVNMFVPSRFGMLSEEPVPHANTILEALAKHLEAKLSYGKLMVTSFDQRMNCLGVRAKLSNHFVLYQIKERQIWSSWRTTLASDTQPENLKWSTLVWWSMEMLMASLPWPKQWATLLLLQLVWSWMVKNVHMHSTYSISAKIASDLFDCFLIRFFNTCSNHDTSPLKWDANIR